MKRLLGSVVVLVALATSRRVLPPTYHATAQSTCGTERWNVKTLADQDAGSVVYTDVVPATVADLVHFSAPTALPENTRIAPVELTTYSVVVNLVEAKVESDHDIHLVIADHNTGDTMIAELPDADNCAPNTDATLVADMDTARSTFVTVFGLPSSDHFVPLSGTAQVTGIGFFDFQHGQEGVAPNGIELHPVLDFEIAQGAGVVPARVGPVVTTPQPAPLPGIVPLPVAQPMGIVGPIAVTANLNTDTCTGGDVSQATVSLAIVVIDANGNGVLGATATGYVQYKTTGHGFNFPPTNSLGQSTTSINTGHPRGGYTVVFSVHAVAAGGYSADTTATCFAP